MNTPSNNGTPLDRLTPEESAQPFPIMEAILSIPFHDLPLHLVKYLLLAASKSGWGQGGCYASHATMGRMTGYPAICAREHREKLIEAGWIAVSGFVINSHGHKMPNVVLGARLIAHIRNYLAQKNAADKAAYRAKHAPKSTHDTNAVPDHQMITHPDALGTSGCTPPLISPTLMPQDITHPDALGTSAIMMPQDITNPGLTGLENRINPPPQSPPEGGSGGGGGSERPETLPRRGGGGRKKDCAPSTQSRWRDLSVIPPEQWTDDENSVMEPACALSQSEGLEGFQAELLSRWPEAMAAAQGRLDILRDVIAEMMRADDRGKTFDSPFGYLLTVSKQRARPKSQTTPAIMSLKQPVQKLVLVPVTKPAELTPEEKELLRQQAVETARKNAEAIQRVQELVAEAQRLPRRPILRIGARA